MVHIVICCLSLYIAQGFHTPVDKSLPFGILHVNLSHIQYEKQKLHKLFKQHLVILPNTTKIRKEILQNQMTQITAY